MRTAGFVATQVEHIVVQKFPRFVGPAIVGIATVGASD
jgi:hypothetical protein